MATPKDKDKVVAYLLETKSGPKLISASSQQVKDPRTWFLQFGLVVPPYNPDHLAKLPEKNTFHSKCCSQISRDVAGLGWSLRPVTTQEEGEEEKPPKEILDFLNHPNSEPGMSLRKTLEAAQFDFESIGWLCLELVRNDGGKPKELWHVPAHTVRIHKSKLKFAQIIHGKKTWFKAFGAVDEKGENFQVDRKSGDIKKSVPKNERANELIFLKNYSTISSFYGVPEIIPAIGAINLLIGIRDYRLDFFENNAIPAWAVIVTGGELTEKTRELIEKHFEELKGTEGSQHSTIVLETEEGVKVTFQRLQTEVREGSFTKLYRDMRDETISSHGVPPYRIGIVEVGSLGGNTALETTKIYKASVIHPRQEDLEEIMNSIIIVFTNGKEEWLFKFSEIDLTDEMMDVNLSMRLISIGTLTPNQVIKRLNLGPTFPEGDVRLVSTTLRKLEDSPNVGPRGRPPHDDARTEDEKGQGKKEEEEGEEEEEEIGKEKGEGK